MDEEGEANWMVEDEHENQGEMDEIEEAGLLDEHKKEEKEGPCVFRGRKADGNTEFGRNGLRRWAKMARDGSGGLYKGVFGCLGPCGVWLGMKRGEEKTKQD